MRLFARRFAIFDRSTAWMLAAWLMVGAGSCSPDSQTANDAGHQTSSVATEKPHHGGRLVIGVQQEPERLSEILNATATTNLICNLIFAKFVKYDDQLRLLPDLIREIPTVSNGGISEDYLTYRYRLREGVRWHDGEPVTSRDVAFTYEIIMDPRINVESREGWDVIRLVETPDPHSVIFHLNEPYPDFVSETFYDEAVLPAHLLDGERGDRFQRAEYHHRPIGCGAFVFKEWVSGSHIVLARNDDYHNDGPYLDEIVFKFIPNENTMLMQLKTGEIDVYDNINTGFVRQVQDLPEVRVASTPTLMYEHLDLNTEHSVLSDKRVRRAIAHAVNKAVIAENVYRGWATVASLDEHPASKYFNPSAASRVTYDTVTARRLLRDAGWIDADGDGIRDKKGQRLELTISATSGNPDRERTELVLRDQLRDVGIDLKIKNYNATVLYGSYEDGGILKRGEFDIAMYAWLSSPEPATKESLYGSNNVPPHGQNHPRFRHAELTGLLSRGASEVEQAERIRIYHSVADILVDEAPVIPLFWYTAVDVCSKSLQNYRPNPTQSSDTWNAHTWYLAN